MASCSDICGSGDAERARGVVSCGHQHYGVRSYLHQFYEECTASIWERDEDFQIKRSPSRWSSVLWKVSLTFGALILTIGLIVLTVGYAVPSRIEAFGEGELLFMDSQATRFNQGLHVSRLAGAALACAGGSLVAAGLLVLAFTTGHPREERRLQAGFEERIAELWDTSRPCTKAPTLGQCKIPVTLSKVQNVQPTS